MLTLERAGSGRVAGQTARKSLDAWRGLRFVVSTSDAGRTATCRQRRGRKE
ncbi:MAG TPA: hypothetical protein VJ842_07470 [Pyrinomonadaceae bacterium]|nr:hypothetical protein [Pyrinomonadaceae bacterium]